MTAERWAPVPGCFSRYEVSDRGRVRVLLRINPQSPRLLRPDSSDTGHLRVRLVDDQGAQHMRWVHRLVLEAFEGPPLVRHLNDDETDNRLENLAYGSRLDNAGDARRNGKHAHGSTHGKAELTEGRVAWIRRRKRAGSTYAELARRLGLSKAAVSAAGRGDTWAHVNSIEPPVRAKETAAR